MSVDDDLDALYGVRPEEFTALRKELSAAAKKRGDAEGARHIAAARRPTTAAWVVNLLVRTDASASARLVDLGEELRTAHEAMDGARIRDLTARQRRLVHELVRAAFDGVGLADPAAALRDDVTGTLQAAIADPEVAGRLGRLEKAEHYAGFGGFGVIPDEVVPAPRRTPAAAEPVAAEPVAPRSPSTPTGPSAADRRAAAKRVLVANRAVDAAREAPERADGEATDRTRAVTAARRRYERLLEQLAAAERHVDEAAAASAAADSDAGAAAERLDAATIELDAAEAARAELDSRVSG